jgi:very-short-patch-repair endonuclease
LKPAFKTVPPDHWPYARELRSRSTEAEKILWQRVRNRQLGPRFRRQHAIGPYIVDFFCGNVRLVIEVDGEIHSEQDAIVYDRQRTAYLETRGCHIKRYSNADVMQRTDEVVSDILDFLNKPS